MYYVYEWYIIETGEIIYVGKGTGRRYKTRKHNKLFGEMIKRFECDSRIVKEFENEKDAFDYEFQRVLELQMKGECVCNIYKGGTGGSTNWWTEERRKEYSEHNIMKSNAQRKRMSENNPMKRKDIAEKSNQWKRRAVIIGDKEYPSVKEAYIQCGVSYPTITAWCRKGLNPYGEKCRYKGCEQPEYTLKRFNKGGSRPVIYNGIEYECVKDCAEANGVGSSTIIEWCRRGFNPRGISCRYADDTSEHIFVDRRRGENKAKRIMINGIIYNSCIDAAKKLDISERSIRSYLLYPSDKPRKYDCKYVD